MDTVSSKNISKGLTFAFMGSPEYSAYILEKLVEQYTPLWVITQPDKKKGRGLNYQQTPVALVSAKYNIPVYKPQKLDNGFVKELLTNHKKPDFIFVVAYGLLIPEYFINSFDKKLLNLHYSLLPDLRGASPVATAILKGYTKTGFSIIEIAPKLDSGDIYFQQSIDISLTDTTESLTWKITKEAISQLLEDNFFQKYISDQITPIPQQKLIDSGNKVTYAKKIQKSQGLIDWAQNAINIHNQVRAFYPWPKAYTFFRAKRLFITQTLPLGYFNINHTESTTDTFKSVPKELGKIVKIEKDGFIVYCGDNTYIKILKLQPESKKELLAKDFVNGYRIKEGEKLS